MVSGWMGYLVEENLIAERPGVFEPCRQWSGLQYRCIWQEAGPRCELQAGFFCLEGSTGVGIGADGVEPLPKYCVGSFSPSLPLSSPRTPPLIDTSQCLSHLNFSMCPPSLSKNRSPEKGTQWSQPGPRDGIQAGREKRTLQSFLQAPGREQLCSLQELGLGTKNHEDRSKCLVALGSRVKVTLFQEFKQDSRCGSGNICWYLDTF